VCQLSHQCQNLLGNESPFATFSVPQPLVILTEGALRNSEACRDQDKKLGGFAPGVIDMLVAYPWPGNVRELRNEIYRACVLAGDGSPVQIHHFSPQITKGGSLMQEVLSEQLSLSASLKHLQRRMVEDALRETGGKRAQAAKRLGMDVANLRHLIKRLGIKA